jgi:hypothetical protein
MDMSVFNTGYSIFNNKQFFDSFGLVPYSDRFDSEEDLIFYKDPYRLY